MTKLGWHQCRGSGWTFSVFPPSVSRATGAGFSFSRAFLTDAAWRGSAASLRMSATISASSACVRGCVGMSPDHYSEKIGKGLVRIAQIAGIDEAEVADQPKNHSRIIATVAAIGASNASASPFNVSL